MAGKTVKELLEEINLLKKKIPELEVSNIKGRDDNDDEMYEKSPLGYQSLNAEGRFIAVNQAWLDTLGYTRDEVMGKWFGDFLAPEFVEGFKKRFEEFKKAGKIHSEFEMLHKNGERRFIAFDGKISYHPSGEFKQTHCLLQDITERKLFMDALNEKEIRYKSLFKFSPDAIFINREDRVVMVNEACLRLFGATKPEQLLRKSPYELFQSDFHAKISERIHRFRDPGEPVSVVQEKIIRLDGTIVDVEVNAAPFYDQGVYSLHVVLRDITERKSAEKALIASEVRYRRLFETAKDGILILDGETGMVIDVNPFLIKMLGYSLEQFKEKEIWALGFFKDAIANHDKFIELQQKGYVRYDNLPLETVNGQRLNVEFVSNVYSVNYKKVIQCNIRDITERKQLEEELIRAHKLDSLGVLAGGIAHDFNNILTGIVGNISLVRHSIDPADRNFEVLNEAEKAVFQAKDLTRQFLTFAKGGMPVKKVTLLSDVLKESAIFATRGSKIKCEFNITPDVRFVHVDPGQISQVISNIVINAVQAMPEGGKVYITAEKLNLSEQSNIPLKAGEYVRITIKDKGCGIPSHHLVKIFDPYFTTKQTGSGLGLATSYSIVKNHDGYITVESELGKGASFSVYIPMFTGKSDKIPVVETTGIKKGHGRILIMDNELMICMVAKRILTGLGYTTESVTDGDQAILLYKKTFGTAEAFDAVILDLTIPGGKGGKETIVALKEINPAVKAVVSSGYSNDPVMANYKSYGFSDVLQKPYRIEEISEIFYNLLPKDKKE